MDTTTSMLLTGAIVVIGRWADDKPVDVRIVVGVVGAALGLSLIGTANEKLARTFGALVLLTAVFRYGVPILKKAELIP